MSKKHHAARSKFGELFINTNLFPKEASKIVSRNFNARQSADYDIETELTEDEASQLLADARTFYQLTLDYFAQNPPADN